MNPLVSGGLLALYGFLIGAAAGALAGLVAHALTRGRRDFASVRGLHASRYDVIVDASRADEAARLLEQLSDTAA